MPETAGPELLRDWIERAARSGADKTWVVSAEDGRSVSYGQLRDSIGRFAAFLRARRLGRNDRVALLANNSIEHLLCYFGVMAAGATVCTVHIEMNRNQLGNIFERLKPRLILYQDGLQLDDLLAATAVPRLRLGRWDKPETGTLFAELAHLPPSEPPPPYPPPTDRRGGRPDDDAIILFTSGTSATPKGVVLNFREYLLNIDPLAEGFGIAADDRLYDFRPFSWNSAQTLGALAVVNRGATLVLAEKFSASRFFQHLREHAVTISTGNPTTINILLNSEQTHGRIHHDACRSSALSLRARRRCCSKSGSASSKNSVSQWRKDAAPAKRAGLPPFQANSAVSAPSGGRLPITISPSSMPMADACRRAKSAMWSSAGSAITHSAISATMAR